MKHKHINLIRLRNIGRQKVDWLRRMPAVHYLLDIARYRKAGIAIILVIAMAQYCFGQAKGAAIPTGVGIGTASLSPRQPSANWQGKSRVASEKAPGNEGEWQMANSKWLIEDLLRPRARRERRQASDILPLAAVTPEFVYYTRDENGKLLKEPSGFPGYWTVEVNMPEEDDTTAAVQRMVKSFSLSLQTGGRNDITKAKFIVVDNLPKANENTLIENNLICVNTSERFGLELVVSSAFLQSGISRQRDVFLSLVQKLPGHLNLPQQKKSENKLNPGDRYTKAKILVFNAPIPSRSRGVGPIYPSAFSLTSILRQAGYNASINNFVYDVRKKAGEQVNAIKEILRDVDIACFSVFDAEMPYLNDFIAELKKAKPDLIIIEGGPSATVMPEHVAAHQNGVNIVYRGEADHGILPILDGVISLLGTDINAKQAAEFFNENQGVFIHFGNIYQFCNLVAVNRITSKDLDNRPFDFSILNKDNIQGSFALMTGMGCPGGCIFCATGGGKIYRAMRPERVRDILKKYQARLEEIESETIDIPEIGYHLGLPNAALCVTIPDDNLLNNPERALLILQLWREAGLRVKNDDIQTTLRSLLKKDKDGKLVVNSELIKSIASYRDIFYKKPRLMIGTDALIDEEIGALGKPSSTFELIEQVMAECEKYDLQNEHYLVVTNADTTVKNLLLTFIRAAFLTAKYKCAKFSGPNIGIILHIGTAAMNRLVERNELSLIKPFEMSASGKEYGKIKGFSEYDYYTLGMYIHSRFIPDSIYSSIDRYEHRLELLNNLGLSDTKGAIKFTDSLDYLNNALMQIDKNLLSSEEITDETWPFYRDLLNPELRAEFENVKEALSGVVGEREWVICHDLVLNIEARLKSIEASLRKWNMDFEKASAKAIDASILRPLARDEKRISGQEIRPDEFDIPIRQGTLMDLESYMPECVPAMEEFLSDRDIKIFDYTGYLKVSWASIEKGREVISALFIRITNPIDPNEYCEFVIAPILIVTLMPDVQKQTEYQITFGRYPMSENDSPFSDTATNNDEIERIIMSRLRAQKLFPYWRMWLHDAEMRSNIPTPSPQVKFPPSLKVTLESI